MAIRRREFRVRLRSDRVGHEAVMNWLDEFERNDRGVAGLQDQVIAILAAHVEGIRSAPAPASPRRLPAAVVPAAPSPRRAEARAPKTAVEGLDPLKLAAQRLEF
jgi:hypothetical protein